jgi:hypothetical protein
MPKQTAPKIQPWKALSSLAEDKNPNLGTRNLNLRANEPACSMGASVSKPMDRKVEYQDTEAGKASKNE